MNIKIDLRTSLMLFLTVMMLSGCSAAGNGRTPQEWLSLSYSGLAALDEFSFAGSLSMGTGEGMFYKPQTFEGKVTDHHQLTLQADGQHAPYWNPADVLDGLNRSNDGVKVERTGQPDGEFPGEDLIWLRVKEKPEATTARWERQLREGLEEVKNNSLRIGESGTAAKESLLVNAEKELDSMLQTLEASAVYDIGIHRKKLLPLKMVENTVFTYKRGGAVKQETRTATVRFRHD